MNRRSLAPLLLFGLSVLPISCAQLDRNPTKIETHTAAPAAKGLIASGARNATASFPEGQSGFRLITRADEALLWRLALADEATSSLDLKYYQWADDEAGLLMINRLIDAAERGVHVRVLVDDYLYGGEEEKLVALCQHPNIDIRIFNPKLDRSGPFGPALEFMARFGTLNQRMHSKMFVADNRMAIMGGRNIGNYYYGLYEDFNMLDVDVITAGPIVTDISASFDEYWNSKPTYPGDQMAPRKEIPTTESVIAELREELADEPGALVGTPYPLESRKWSAEFAQLRSEWIPGTAVMISDEPTASTEREGRRLLDLGHSLVGRPDSTELLFVSPYLVPTKETYETLAKRQSEGVKVRLVAPGLGSNNQPVVHSHYRQHRRKLLKHGVDLHEIREDGTDEIDRINNVLPDQKPNTGLHAKVGVGDRKRSFIGSLNLDPRSQDLNMENGLIIESPELARQLADHIDYLADPDNSWHVTVDEQGRLNWESRGETVRRQPGPKGFIRISDFLYGLIPVEGLL